MSCSLDYIEYVCGQINAAGVIRYRKMFGDYVIYVNEKPLVLCCDGISYVKKHATLAVVCQNAECGYPYDGAKEHYVLDVDHKELALNILGILDEVVPLRKKKSSRKK